MHGRLKSRYKLQTNNLRVKTAQHMYVYKWWWNNDDKWWWNNVGVHFYWDTL